MHVLSPQQAIELGYKACGIVTRKSRLWSPRHGPNGAPPIKPMRKDGCLAWLRIEWETGAVDQWLVSCAGPNEVEHVRAAVGELMRSLDGCVVVPEVTADTPAAPAAP